MCISLILPNRHSQPANQPSKLLPLTFYTFPTHFGGCWAFFKQGKLPFLYTFLQRYEGFCCYLLRKLRLKLQTFDVAFSRQLTPVGGNNNSDAEWKNEKNHAAAMLRVTCIKACSEKSLFLITIYFPLTLVSHQLFKMPCFVHLLIIVIIRISHYSFSWLRVIPILWEFPVGSSAL